MCLFIDTALGCNKNTIPYIQAYILQCLYPLSWQEVKTSSRQTKQFQTELNTPVSMEHSTVLPPFTRIYGDLFSGDIPADRVRSGTQGGKLYKVEEIKYLTVRFKKEI